MKKERIKLFSGKSRIRLFGDVSPNPELIPTSHKGKILVCQDCGFQIEDPGTGSTKETCPNCGGSRFNYLESMTNPTPKIQPSQGISETDKAFSELRRRRISLFSNSQEEVGKRVDKKNRLSLFSSLTHRQPNNTGEGTDNGTTPETIFRCTDCGHKFTLKCDTVSGTRCPNCGGNRVVKVTTQSDSDTTGEFLSRVAGQTLSQDEATKVFSECGAKGTLQDLVDSGYATITEDSEVSFSDTVESEYSLFSKLVISVTKELELPEIPQGQREDLISSMSSLSPKGVLLIKRAHRLVPHPSDVGVVTGIPSEDIHDLGQDGNIMTLQEFLDYIRLKYNDAPENLSDILCKNGIVKISDGQIATKPN